MDDILNIGIDTSGSTAVSSFDGKITAWPSTQALTISNVPKERKEFILYMSCELFKAQHITDPKKQANNSINFAKSLYDALAAKGYLGEKNEK